VKLYFHLSRYAAFCLGTILLSLFAGCGQRGPLYLPKNPEIIVPKTPAAARVTPSQVPTDAPLTVSP